MNMMKNGCEYFIMSPNVSEIRLLRMGGWFVLSAVFMVAVFGLFFTFTERRTWPEKRTELSATDMRLLPPVSTLWCEAVSLHSDHPFVAYQVNQTPFINPSRLSRQIVAFSIRLNGGRFSNSVKLKYYLLPSSVLLINVCAVLPGARILVFKGEEDVQNWLKSLTAANSESSDSASSEEDDEDSSSIEDRDMKKPSSLISSHEISVLEETNVAFSCEGFPSIQPLQVNISAADFYTIVLLNTLDRKSNHIGIRITIDRARYSVQKSGHTFDMCSLATSCTIGLAFASSDRALVWIPDEPNSGRSTFVVRSQCRPRLAVFAILSVFLPLIIFIIVAFVVRADRERIMRRYERNPSGHNRAASPLLDDGLETREGDSNAAPSQIADEQPPPYDSVYDPPPPYSCVKDDTSK